VYHEYIIQKYEKILKFIYFPKYVIYISYFFYFANIYLQNEMRHACAMVKNLKLGLQDVSMNEFYNSCARVHKASQIS
jgi:hypothetical protein